MSTQDKVLSINTHERGGPSRAAYLLALPPIIVLLVYKIIPFIVGLILSFIDYDLTKGIARSSWVGMTNFRELFNSSFFSKIIVNTLILKLEYIFFCSAAAFLLAIILGFIRSKFWQRFFSTIFLLPYFIPTVVFGYLILYTMNNAGAFFVFSTESLTNPETFRLVYPILESIKNIGIPLIIALGAVNAKRELDDGGGNFLHIQLIPTLKAIGLFALIQLSASLTSDYELLTYFQNPIVLETAETLDTYAFKTGLLDSGFSIASAAWLIKYIIQLVISILIFMLIKKCFAKDIFPKKNKKGESPKRRGSLVAVVAGLFIVEIYLLITTAPLALSVVEAFKDSSEVASDFMIEAAFYSNFTTYIFAIAFAVVINAILTILLAYPLTVKGISGSRIYTVFLILVLNMGMGEIHEYLFFRKLGMVNTILPYLITGFFTLANVFVLKSIYNATYTSIEERTVKGIEGDIGSFFKRYLPKTIKPVLGLAALQFAFMWNSSYPGQLVYIADSNKFSPVMYFSNIIRGAQPDIYGLLTHDIMKLAAIISIPSLIILLLIMIFGKDEIFIGQIRKS